MDESIAIRLRCLEIAQKRLGSRAPLADVLVEAERLEAYVLSGKTDE